MAGGAAGRRAVGGAAPCSGAAAGRASAAGGGGRVDAELQLGGHAELIAELQSLATRASAAGAVPRPADAGAVPLRPAGRGAGRVPASPRRAGRGAGRRARSRSCASCTGRCWPPTRPGRAGPAARARARAARARCRGSCRRRWPAFVGRAAELAALTATARPGRRPGAGGRGDLGDRRDGRGGQDRAGGALGPPGRRAVPRRAAVREPARLSTRASRCRGDALAGFLRALGVPAARISRPEPTSAPRRYRSLLAGRRMLVVLDNAAIGGAGPAAAARHAGLRGGGDQPRLAGRAGRPGRRPPAGSGPAPRRRTRWRCCGR